MKVSFEYDTGYFPAFPVLELSVSNPGSSESRSLVGLIDTGSDATQFPLSVLKEMNARLIDRRWVRDLAGIRIAVPVYPVVLQIGTVRLPPVEVIGRQGVAELIIGRDVLNQFIITLNGLANVVELSD